MTDADVLEFEHFLFGPGARSMILLSNSRRTGLIGLREQVHSAANKSYAPLGFNRISDWCIPLYREPISI